MTGYLHYSKGNFFQYIEGMEQGVSDLMSRIAKDQRHKIILQFEKENLSQRKFPGWSMKYLTPVDMPNIGLEQLIEMKFEYIEKKVGDRERWIEMLWGTIDKIANLKRTYSQIN